MHTNPSKTRKLHHSFSSNIPFLFVDEENSQERTREHNMCGKGIITEKIVSVSRYTLE